MKKFLAGALVGAGLSTLVTRQSRRDEQSFRDILRGLTLGSDPEALLQRIAERAAKLVNASGAYIERADIDGDRIVSTAGWGDGLPPVGTEGPLCISLPTIPPKAIHTTVFMFMFPLML
jgi:hypothetical protein